MCIYWKILIMSNKQLEIMDDGWLNLARIVKSQFFNKRPQNEISLLVIHNISLPPKDFSTVEYIDNLFTGKLDPKKHEYFETIYKLEVSSHFMIDREGRITQYVSCLDRAWHCGVSNFEEREACNDFAIGIELQGTDDVSYSEAQYESLSLLTKAIIRKYKDITVDRIVGHCDIAPTRKSDPGESFEWSKYKSMLS
jgi:AmpD protein